MNKWFLFPDGSREEIAAVMAGKASTHRFPATYLRMIAEERVYSGDRKIGVTRALNGTRMEWLRLVTDEEVDVDGAAFRLLGLAAHAELEKSVDGEEAERQVEYDGIRGRLDLIETIAVSGEVWLWDYKVIGSYPVANDFGLVEVGRREKIGPDGKPEVYKRSGKWGAAGTPKTEPVYKFDTSAGDVWKYAMQLNFYRIAVEAEWKGKGDPRRIDQMAVLAVVRDGGTQAARSRGVMQRSYPVVIPRYDDDKVLDYFRRKRDALYQFTEESSEIRQKLADGEVSLSEFVAEARKLEVIPPMCDARENWDGRRCREYCQAASTCAMIGDNKYLRNWGTDAELAEF